MARVRELVDQHPEVINARATWNETPIEAATQMGNRPIIDFLVERGAPVDFFTACVLGDTGRVAAELAADSGRAQQRGVHDLPSLYFAAIGGSRAVAELLLAAGAGVNEHAEAAAPIHGAVMGGDAEMVRLLLSRGADPQLPDFKGRGATQLAEDMQRPDLVLLFDDSQVCESSSVASLDSGERARLRAPKRLRQTPRRNETKLLRGQRPEAPSRQSPLDLDPEAGNSGAALEFPR